MNLGDTELVALTIAFAGGVGALIKMILSDRRHIERRIDQLEKESITRQEFDEFAKEIHAHNGKLRDLMDKKLEQVSDSIMWLVRRQRNSDNGDER